MYNIPMKVSAWVSVSDLVTVKKTLLEKIITIVLKDEKVKIYRTQPFDLIFSSLRKAGVDGLELLVQKHTTDKNIHEIKKLSIKYHLPILSIHQSLDSFGNISLTEIERLCHIANSFLAKVIVIHANALGSRLFDTTFIDTLKNLQKKYTIAFGIENMPKSYFTLHNPHTWKGQKFSSVMGKAGLSITFDTTHLAQVQEDICDFYLNNKKQCL